MIVWAPHPTGRRLVADGVGALCAEVTIDVPVVVHESWGTDRRVYTVAGQHPLSGIGGRDDMDKAFDIAYANALDVARSIQFTHPDYAKPARY